MHIILLVHGTRLGIARIWWALSTLWGAGLTTTRAKVLDMHCPEALAAATALATFCPFAPRPNAVSIAGPVCGGSGNRREHQQRQCEVGSHPELYNSLRM